MTIVASRNVQSNQPTIKSSINGVLGSFVGLAVCDALGGPNEFRSKSKVTKVEGDYISGGAFNLAAGEWTDDTSMALCLAHSILETGFDLEDQLRKYLAWYKQGYMSPRNYCFDIGTTTSESLRRFEVTGDVAARYQNYGHFRSNGSIMRLAPVVLAYYANPSLALILAGESTKTTHNSKTHVDCCQYLAALILGALQGFSKEEILHRDFQPAGATGFFNYDEIVASVDDVMRGEYKKDSYRPGSEGEVTTTLSSALWAFHTTDNFKDGAIACANLGGDSDTIAAVYGQIAGAYYGFKAIPNNWYMGLHNAELILSTAERLYAFSSQK